LYFLLSLVLALDCITILFVFNDYSYSLYYERIKYGGSFSFASWWFYFSLTLFVSCFRLGSVYVFVHPFHAFIYSFILGRISVRRDGCVELRITSPVFEFR
jgi:hypothetical protein